MINVHGITRYLALSFLLLFIITKGILIFSHEISIHHISNDRQGQLEDEYGYFYCRAYYYQDKTQVKYQATEPHPTATVYK